MKIRVLGIVLAMAAILSGCRKPVDGERQVYTLKGKALGDCDGRPYANRKLYLDNYTNVGAFASQEHSAETYTDSDGNFSFQYSRVVSTGNDIALSDEYQIVAGDGNEAGNVLVTRIPALVSLELKTAYANSYTRLYLEIQKPAGSILGIRDSLFVGISATEYAVFVPAQTKQQLLSFRSSGQVYEARDSKRTLYFGIGRVAYDLAVTNPGISNSLSYTDGGCGSVADTVELKTP